MEKLADWINTGMHKRGWSTIQLAERAGVSKQVISKYIGQQPPKTPDLDVLHKISTAFDAQITEPLMIMGYLKGSNEVEGLLNLLSKDDLEEILEIARMKLDRQKPTQQTSRSKRPARNALKEK